jgi:hypothetical protein
MGPKKNTTFSTDLANILVKAMDTKIYGSVEVYFEAGKITQITQRIINKISSNKGKDEVRNNQKLAQEHFDPLTTG